MFKEIIRKTDLTDDIANASLSNLVSTFEINGDTSFCATLRALVIPRLKEGQYLRINKVHCGGFTDAEMAALSNDFLTIIETADREPVGDVCGKIESNMDTTFKGFKEVKKVKAFFEKQLYIRCYVNVERRISIVVVDSLSRIRYVHYIQAGIIAFLPWLFTPAEGISKLEHELLKALQEPTADKYLEIIAKFSKLYDMKTLFIEQNLKDIYQRADRGEISRLRACNDSLEDELREIYDRISRILAERDKNNVLLSGYMNREEPDSDELISYFKTSKSVDLERIEGNRIFFTARGYVSYWDEAMAERIINNDRSTLYRDHYDMSDEELRVLLDYIFIKKELKLNVFAGYSLSLFGDPYAATDAGLRNWRCKYTSYLPNPHIDRYACLGRYVETIVDAMEHNNAIGAIEQCVASALSLNFGDSSVMAELSDKLASNEAPRCVVLPDESVVTPIDAVKWIHDKEEGEDKNE